MAGPDSGALNPVFDSQELQRALQEAAWAARLLLHLDASVIFLSRSDPNVLTSVAWHGREAEGATLSAQGAAIKPLWLGRRSISWDRRTRCPDAELGAVLDSMGLRSGLLVPLSANGQYVGIWLAASAAERTYQANDELIMSTLAENIGLTTESMLLAAENLRYRREADALYEIGKEISQLMDLDQVLKLIAQKACALLDAGISYIALADDEAKEVRVRVTEGARNDHLRTMVLKYGEGVGGWVASNRKPLLVDNYPSDRWPKPPGIAYIAATEDIVSIISVPMVTRRGLIGVLFAADRREAVFNHLQMNLLSALGTQAAIAIENAHLYAVQKEAVEKLRANITTHEQLLALVLGNHGLQAIAHTLSDLVHCPVAVYDSRFHLLHASLQGVAGLDPKPATPPSDAPPDAWLDVELRERLDMAQNARRTVRLPPRPERRNPHPRTAAPVVAGNRLLGYVVVVEIGDGLNEQQLSAVEQASIVLALEFLKQEAAQAAEQRLAGDLLDDLLFGHIVVDSAVYQRAARLGVDLRCAHRVIVADIDGFAQEIKKHAWNDLETLAIKRRFMAAVSDVVRLEAPGALIGMRGDSVLSLVPERPAAAVNDAKMLARAMQRAVRAVLPGLSVSMGIGCTASDPATLSRSHEDALTALRSAALMARGNCVVALEDLGVLPLLLQSEDQQGLMIFMERHLRALLDYDAQHDTQLTATLRHFLGNAGNLRCTAEACHVHLNSLKYRMQRIRELTGLDLDDGQTRFNLQLALSIHSALDLLRPEG